MQGQSCSCSGKTKKSGSDTSSQSSVAETILKGDSAALLPANHNSDLDNAPEIYKKSLGDCHVSVANTYCNMGIVYRKLGKFKKALKMYKKDLKITVKCQPHGEG